MITDFFGFKLGQEQAFLETGRRLVVSKIKALPLEVLRIKSQLKDGYRAVQVKISKPGQRRPVIREIKVTGEGELKPGDQIKPSTVFQPEQVVQVTGTTKGKGFQGVMKRWGFKGGPRTHGQSDRQRSPGSIGMRSTPGRVWKGKHMPGHMGERTKTIKNLKVYKIDEEKDELLVTGLIPGNQGRLVKISPNK